MQFSLENERKRQQKESEKESHRVGEYIAVDKLSDYMKNLKNKGKKTVEKLAKGFNRQFKMSELPVHIK